MPEILAKIKPKLPEQQKMKKMAASFSKKIKLKDTKILLGGSGAKDTWLSGNHDIDIYVLFDYKKYVERSAELSDILHSVLKKAFPKLKRVHGSRDYFQIKYQNFEFEVIPILNIKKAEQAKNITDISPLHAVWVNKHTKGMKDDVRLLKQFLKAHNLYGAESHLMGFSGYVVEILIAYYGSFEKVLTAAQRWTVKEVIDPEKYYPSGDVLFELNQSKTHSPIIVIDPVDKSRNAAAALSEDAFFKFKKFGREYLQKPDNSFFVKKELNFAKLKKRTQHNLIFVTVNPFSGKEDVVGTKILKVFEYLKMKLLHFKLKEAEWDWNKMYFIVERMDIPKEEVLKGPPLEMEEHAKRFRKKYRKDAYEEKGRLMVKIPVKNPQLEKYVAALVKENYIKERVKRIKVQVD